MRYLAGDIGGTKTNLAVFNEEGGRLLPVAEATFVSREYPGLEQVVEEFLETADGVSIEATQAAAFGIAGPVMGDICRTPNLPWVVDARIMRKLLGVSKVKLLNDLEANGWGIPVLSEDQLVTLNQGTHYPEGHGALISAGTGLGEAFLFNDGKKWIPVASEGGHASFAPRNDLEFELLRYLQKEFGHVSYERVVSGLGIHNLYRFLRDTGRGEEPDWLTREIRDGDPTVAISKAAAAGRSELCEQTMRLFVSLYGAEAGNLALKCKALGGLYVGGGIAPRIIDRMKDGTFMQAFVDKGRLSPLVKEIPVRVILNPKTALYGAGRCAAQL